MNEIVKNNSETKENNKEIIGDLKDLKSDIIETKLNDLEISKSSKQVLDLIENKPDGTKTNMYQKLEKLEGDDFNIEKFSQDIDRTVRRYLYQTFFDGKSEFKVDDRVIDSMSVGIQFAMMKTLSNVGEKGVDFFDSFSKIKTEGVSSMFDGLFDVIKGKSGMFGKIGKLNEFYVLANRFQNLTGYIAHNAGKEKPLGDASKIVEIMNSAKFVKLLDNPILDNQDGLFNRKSSELGLNISEENLEMQDQDKLFLQSIADNVNMPIDKKTINAIKNAIPTAQTLLEKRFTFKDNISVIVDKISGILDINLMGFGTLGSLLGIKSPIDFLRGEKGKKKGILDFILIGIGFQGGVEGLHREYVRKNINENLDSNEKRNFISEMFKYYDKEKKSEYKGVNTIDKFGLSKMDEGLKNKIPTQYDLIKQSLIENVSGNKKLINPNILSKYGFQNFLINQKYIDQKGKEKTRLVVDETKIEEINIDEKIIDKYLEDSFKELISNENFMKDLENPDQFTLALMGNLVAGSWFIEGVLIGEELVDSYLVTSNVEQNQQTTKREETDGDVEFSGGDAEILEKIRVELTKYNSPIKAENVLDTSKQYNVPVEYIMAFMKNDSSYATAGKGARTNNPGNIGNDDAGNEKNYNSLRDGVSALGKHLRWRIDEYQKVYGLVMIPTAKHLADNIGPDGKGFLSNQANYKKPNPDRKGAYMSMKTGGNTVDNFVEDLADFGITNYDQVA